MPLALQHAGDVLLASFFSQWGFFSFFFLSCPPHTPPPLLSLLLRYVDDGKTAAARGKLYKIYVPVHRNRSIETWATLSNASGAVLLTFKVHAHGKSKLWPAYIVVFCCGCCKPARAAPPWSSTVLPYTREIRYPIVQLSSQSPCLAPAKCMLTCRSDHVWYGGIILLTRTQQ